MKKQLLILVLLILSIFTYGQSLPKGALLGFHYSQPVLNPDVTMAQYQAFVKSKLIPAYEKNFPGLKVYLLKGKRGELTEKIGFLMVFSSEKARDKYWKPDGNLTELGESVVKKMQPIQDEMNKLAKSDADLYTDWIIQ